MIDHAMEIARVFGPFMVIMGIWLLSYQSKFSKVSTVVKSTPAVFFIGGVFNLLMGLYIINVYNDWEWNLAALVTLLGWVLFVRGILMFFATEAFLKCIFSASNSFFKISRILILLWGIGLCWLGFSA